MKRPGDVERSVVFFGGQDWWYHNRAHSDMQLALQVAEHRRVLLVNSIGTRMPTPRRSTQVRKRLVNKLRSIGRFVRHPVPELPDFYVYSPLSVPLYQSALGRRFNEHLLRAQVGVVRWWLRMGASDVVVTPPTAWAVVSKMRRRSLVFNRSDKHSSWEEVDHDYVLSCEQLLLRSADVVLYVSHALMAEDAVLAGGRSVFLDHGVNLDVFSLDGPTAAELDQVPRKRVGYFGALRDTTVDIALLERVARDMPEVSLVLVGPATADLTALVRLSNVFWFGARPHEVIPSFGRGFDVALMPWHDNEWIRNCNPVKLKEYLALGLPIVTMDFPEVHRYAGLVKIASTPVGFVAAIRQALTETADPQVLRHAVEADSWQARSVHLLNAMDEAGVRAGHSRHPAS